MSYEIPQAISSEYAECIEAEHDMRAFRWQDFPGQLAVREASQYTFEAGREHEIDQRSLRQKIGYVASRCAASSLMSLMSIFNPGLASVFERDYGKPAAPVEPNTGLFSRNTPFDR